MNKEDLFKRQFVIEEFGNNYIEYRLLLYQHNGETITICINETFNLINLEYKLSEYSEMNWVPISNCKTIEQLDNLIDLFSDKQVRR